MLVLEKKKKELKPRVNKHWVRRQGKKKKICPSPPFGVIGKNSNHRNDSRKFP